MSYTPTEWQTGDTITAEKLNNMESGIENANEPLFVTLTPTAADLSGTMDKSPQEIAEAVVSGKRIFIAVPSLGDLAGEMNQFIPVPTDGGDPLYEVWGDFVYLDYNGIDVFIIIKLRPDLASAPTYRYDTNIYPLTPMS